MHHDDHNVPSVHDPLGPEPAVRPRDKGPAVNKHHHGKEIITGFPGVSSSSPAGFGPMWCKDGQVEAVFASCMRIATVSG